MTLGTIARVLGTGLNRVSNSGVPELLQWRRGWDQERTDATPQKDNANATISTLDSPGARRYPLRSRKPVVKLDL